MAPVVLHTTLAGLRRDKVAGIKLDPHTIRIHIHADAGFCTSGARSKLHGTVRLVQCIIVVIAARIMKLRIIRFDVPSNLLHLPEIKRRAGYFCEFSGRNRLGVNDRRIIGCVKFKLLPFHRAGIMSVQIKVGMVRKVRHRRLIADCLIGDRNLPVIIQGVRDFRRHIAREILFPVAAYIGKRNALCALLHHIPDHCVKTVRSAVQIVLVVIRFQLVVFSVQMDMCMIDPVRVAPDHRSEIAGIVLIINRRIVSEHNVIYVSV